MGLSNIILKWAFRRAFDGTTNGNTENSKCIKFTIYLLSFVVEIKKVCSSSSSCNVQFRLFINYGVEPYTHIYEKVRSFSVEPKI